MTFSRYSYASAAIGAMLVAFSTSAFAQEPNAVAQRLKETMATQGAILNWSSVSGSGSQVVLEGVTYGAAGMPDMFTLGKVTLDGVTEANGGYTVATATFPAVNFTNEGVTVTTSESTLNNMRIPAAGETDYLKSMLFYDSGKVDRVEIKQGDKQLALIENTNFTATSPDSNPMTFEAQSEKITADLSAIPDPQTQAIVTALGYQQVTGNLQTAGSWNTADGHMQLTKFDITADNAGKIGLTLDIGGYTPQLMQAMQEITKKMGESGGQPDQAQGIAMMGLMQQVMFNGASIRFEDASITNKALDFMAKQQGADPQQLKEQTKTIVPFLLASSPIKDEALKQSIAAAVSAYLDNPKSLTIRAKPATPQPMMNIAMQAQMDPANIATTLGVTVTAND